jgi:hypothetical protein
MKNNLVAKLIYRSCFCMFSFITILFITGFFSLDGHDTVTLNEDVIYYYTNLSNYLCFGVMLACLVDDARQLLRGTLRGHTRAPFLKHLKFVATPIIAVTFVAYGLLLGEPDTLRFWNDLPNISYHVFCPVLFILDTLLFDEHKTIGYLDPFLTLVLPFFYVVVIEIMGAKTGRYPYFFLNAKELGMGGLCMWLAILLGMFLLLGYLLFLYDKLVKRDGKWRLDFAGTRAFWFSRH